MLCAVPNATFKTPDRGALKGEVWDALSSLFMTMWLQQRVIYTPSGILDMVWRLFPEFAGFRQQDAQELLGLMLDDLVERSGPKRQEEARALLSGESVTRVKHKKGPPSVSSQIYIGTLTA